ncbi:hypothetical protein OUZ56_026371, partial [Daphnia magna]
SRSATTKTLYSSSDYALCYGYGQRAGRLRKKRRKYWVARVKIGVVKSKNVVTCGQVPSYFVFNCELALAPFLVQCNL